MRIGKTCALLLRPKARRRHREYRCGERQSRHGRHRRRQEQLQAAKADAIVTELQKERQAGHMVRPAQIKKEAAATSNAMSSTQGEMCIHTSTRIVQSPPNNDDSEDPRSAGLILQVMREVAECMNAPQDGRGSKEVNVLVAKVCMQRVQVTMVGWQRLQIRPELRVKVERTRITARLRKAKLLKLELQTLDAISNELDATSNGKVSSQRILEQHAAELWDVIKLHCTAAS